MRGGGEKLRRRRRARLKRRAIVRTICDYPESVPFGEIAGRAAPEPFTRSEAALNKINK